MVYITQVLKALLRYIETSIINKLIMINFLKSDPEISMLGHFFFLPFFSFFITARDDYQIYKFYVTASNRTRDLTRTRRVPLLRHGSWYSREITA